MFSLLWFWYGSMEWESQRGILRCHFELNDWVGIIHISLFLFYLMLNMNWYMHIYNYNLLWFRISTYLEFLLFFYVVQIRQDIFPERRNWSRPLLRQRWNVRIFHCRVITTGPMVCMGTPGTWWSIHGPFSMFGSHMLTKTLVTKAIWNHRWDKRSVMEKHLDGRLMTSTINLMNDSWSICCQ